MPYSPSFPLTWTHFNTIGSNVLRRTGAWSYQREVFDLPDGDFLDLDWRRSNRSDTLLVGLHGMEGSSHSHYMRGIMEMAHGAGWDGLIVNFRSCGGRLNRLPRLYHSGDTDDLRYVLQFALPAKYRHLLLMGFSLGGNVLLKFLGEEGDGADDRIRGAVAVSVPVHLPSAAAQIDRWENWLYRMRFMLRLRAKMRAKSQQFPGEIPMVDRRPTTFAEFDDWYTAPLHGFPSAQVYWEEAASLNYLPFIRVPTLLINALDDSFLSPACYPRALARTHSFLRLEAPRFGGHVGFAEDVRFRYFWTERQALQFFRDLAVSND